MATEKTKLPHMPLYVYEIRADEACSLMELDEFGAYMRLLQHQWIEGSMPSDEAKLMRLLGVVDPDVFARIWGVLSSKFEGSNGRLVNPKLHAIREATIVKVETNRANGRAGGKARAKAIAKADGQAFAKANASIRASDSDSYSSSVSSKGKGAGKGGKTRTRPRQRYTPEFETWWLTFPRVGQSKKADAAKAYVKAIDLLISRDGMEEPDAHALLLESAKAYAQSDVGKSQFAGHASTWLNGERWMDNRESWKRSDAGLRLTVDPVTAEEKRERSERVRRMVEEREQRRREYEARQNEG